MLLLNGWYRTEEGKFWRGELILLLMLRFECTYSWLAAGIIDIGVDTFDAVSVSETMFVWSATRMLDLIFYFFFLDS